MICMEEKVNSDTRKIKYPTEKNVAQYLNLKGIRWKHNFPVIINDEDRNQRVWYPDFYLPDLGLFVEVCGTEKDKREKYRRACIYKENEISVVFLHYWKDDKQWKSFLETEINSIERGRVCESKKLKCS